MKKIKIVKNCEPELKNLKREERKEKSKKKCIEAIREVLVRNEFHHLINDSVYSIFGDDFIDGILELPSKYYIACLNKFKVCLKNFDNEENIVNKIEKYLMANKEEILVRSNFENLIEDSVCEIFGDDYYISDLPEKYQLACFNKFRNSYFKNNDSEENIIKKIENVIKKIKDYLEENKEEIVLEIKENEGE